MTFVNADQPKTMFKLGNRASKKDIFEKSASKSTKIRAGHKLCGYGCHQLCGWVCYSPSLFLYYGENKSQTVGENELNNPTKRPSSSIWHLAGTHTSLI